MDALKASLAKRGASTAENKAEEEVAPRKRKAGGRR